MHSVDALCICKIVHGKGLLIVVNPNLSPSRSSSMIRLNHSRRPTTNNGRGWEAVICRAFARVPRR